MIVLCPSDELVSMPATIESLGQQLDDALKQGSYERALNLLRSFCQEQPLDPQAQHQLGLLEELVGTPSGARTAYLRCLALAPSVPKAYLYAAYCLEQQGHTESALNLYSLGAELDETLLTLWQSNAQSAEAKRRSKAASRALRSFLSTLHRDSVGPAEDCRRVASAIWTRTHDQNYQFGHDSQRPQLFYLPEIASRGFEESDGWHWVSTLQKASKEIQQELLAALPEIDEHARPYLAADSRLDESFSDLRGSLNWTALDLFADGVLNSAVAAHFPKTLEALSTLPLYGLDDKPFEVFFSLLRPGQHIKPHFGLSNHSLTVHLPLIVPKGGWLRVGEETREWQVGTVEVFDDTFIHEACNAGDSDRIVMIFSIWHPDLTASEREAIRRSFSARRNWLGARRVPSLSDFE